MAGRWAGSCSLLRGVGGWRRPGLLPEAAALAAAASAHGGVEVMGSVRRTVASA
ncbi:MAG TPA: hypothetical protein VH307_13260 [Streptosporangiaceae bacterium]|jgi:hypothetical protein|nr:hypothetical protein [Streptosporangiaceae bacterium]